MGKGAGAGRGEAEHLKAVRQGAGMAALGGKKEVPRGVPRVPEEAITGVREDVDTVKQGVRI